MAGSILAAIRRELPELSARQKLVANYILSDHQEAAFLTSTQLAEASGTSDATVIRFANRLGFRRYADMQSELRELVRGKLSQIERLEFSQEPQEPSSFMQMARQSMQTDIHSIERTLADIREEELIAVVRAVVRARRVYVIATHSEYGLACYFASSLSWIRENVHLLDETHNPSFDCLADTAPGDLAVAISFPPYPAGTVRLLDAAVARGAEAVAITDSPLSPLAQRADHCLLAHDEKLSFADNSAPTVSLLSVILSLASQEDFQRSSEALKKKAQYWEEINFYYREKDQK